MLPSICVTSWVAALAFFALRNRDDRSAMTQALLTDAAHRHSDGIVFFDPRDTFFKRTFCPKIHQHSLQSTGAAMRSNLSFLRERPQRFAAAGHPQDLFLHLHRTEGGKPFYFFFACLIACG